MRTRRKSSCCSRRQGAKRTASWASWRASWSAAESWASWRASWSAAERRSPPRRKSSVERKALVCSRRHTKKNALRVFLHTLSIFLNLPRSLPPPPPRAPSRKSARAFISSGVYKFIRSKRRRMSAPLSSRPLGAALKTASSAPAATTTTTTPRSSQRTNASADSASFPSSSSAPTTRVLANGTLSQGLWLDRSALAYDILVGQVRRGENSDGEEAHLARGLSCPREASTARHRAAFVEALFSLFAPFSNFCGEATSRVSRPSKKKTGRAQEELAGSDALDGIKQNAESKNFRPPKPLPPKNQLAFFFPRKKQKQNFVVHRPRRGGPGLVPSPRPPAFATRAARPAAAGPEGGVPSRFTRPRSGPPARRGSGGGAGSSSVAASPRFLLSAAGGDSECSAAAAFFDVTEYSVVESSSSSSSSSTALSASAAFSASSPRVFILGTSGGLAAPNSSSSSSPSFSQNSNNPRRTRRLAWTCNLCGGRKVSPVNPLAWEKGSVFIRCPRCDVVHKVKDNLKIFHELAGQVYPMGNRAGSATLPPEAAAAAEAALRKWNQGN